ncbi:unnamed protein product [Ambrosiozyma monospora]|uniref:Unnamed protein product n=1 Tax=Ambrosiozyma monospora TaxID=43982 RepID=A0ACB5SZ41_AMBMO|nr:unnamed protein product [Ambrosiozyma monospora]
MLSFHYESTFDPVCPLRNSKISPSTSNSTTAAIDFSKMMSPQLKEHVTFDYDHKQQHTIEQFQFKSIDDLESHGLTKSRTIYQITIIISLIVAEIVVLIGVVLQSCAQNYGMFLVGGLFIGFGGSIGMVAATSLVSELAYPPYRQVMSVICATSWFIGANFSSWLGYGTRDVNGNWCWRITAICACVLPVLQLCFIWMVPESPRWLISKDRDREARAMLLKHHGGNNEEVAGKLVDFEMCEIKAAIQAEKVASNYRYSDLFKTPANRKRMFLAFMCSMLIEMSGNTVISYYINKVLESIGYTSKSEKMLINGGMMVYSYGVCLFATYTVCVVGNKPTK